MAYILTNPGVYLREISDDLALPMGVVQYHLWVLGKKGELEECRSGRYRRFFGAARYPETKRKVLSLLRQGTAGRILSSLSEKPLTHMKLAAMLGVSSQALSWHMRRLREMGMIGIETQDQGQRMYVLPEHVCQEVRAYLASIQSSQPGLFEAPPIHG